MDTLPPSFQKGWECPKCGRTYSPTTPMCFFCPYKYQEKNPDWPVHAPTGPTIRMESPQCGTT